MHNLHRAKLGDSSLLAFVFLKNGICMILGDHKPHRHDKAVPHWWEVMDSIVPKNQVSLIDLRQTSC